jgi:hypothetical protein
VIPNRLILALAVPFGEEDRNEGEVFHAEQFGQFLDKHEMDPPIRMLRDHKKSEVFGPRYVTGWWYAYSVVPASSIPAGLLALGVFSYAPAGEARLEEVRAEPSQWSVSIGARDVSPLEDRSQLYLGETSLTRDPAWASARVLGVGLDAANRWQLYTEQPVPDLPLRGFRTVEDPQTSYIVGNRQVRPSWEEPIWRADAEFAG